MQLESSASLPASPEVVFAEVANLGTYPSWLTIVQRAERLERRDDEPGPAWLVDLGGRIGPVRRTKQVRMVRVEGRPPKRVAFERREHDGRQHSAWVLTAEVEAARRGSRLTIGLHYGGTARIPGLERLLREEMRKAAGRLEERLRSAGAAAGPGR